MAHVIRLIFCWESNVDIFRAVRAKKLFKICNSWKVCHNYAQFYTFSMEISCLK